MNLSTSDLSKIVHNVLRGTFDEKGCLHFNRFSQKQRETYAQESQDWAMKTLSSASATFDFITDSDYITLKFDLFPGSSKKWGGFSLIAYLCGRMILPVLKKYEPKSEADGEGEDNHGE